LRLVRKAEDSVSQLDMNSFTKIIENLIVNAIKYTNTGGITIEIDKNILEGVSWCVLKVKDTGIGISKENIELIFEEFRQVSEGLSRKFEGSGLGLTIAKKFVELMGGKITAESEPGIGSTFSIMFKSVVPNSITVEPEIQTAMVNISSYPSQKTKSKPTFYTLLLVEDDKYSKEIAIRYLKDLYKVEFAEKGEVAVRMAADKQYDAVLMDINLGFGLSGLDAANMIRKLKGYEEVPIIAVTAYAMDNDREKFLNNGCTHYISKPYDKESLIGILDEALNNTQVRSGKVISGKTVS
jgi:CheY-like chemotaxis protein